MFFLFKLFLNIFSKNKTVETSYVPSLQFVPIFVDSLKLVRSTKNPDTFFSRYELLVDCANKLLKTPTFIWENKSASQWTEELSAKQANYVNDFLVRCLNANRGYLLEKDWQVYEQKMPVESIEFYKRYKTGK